MRYPKIYLLTACVLAIALVSTGCGKRSVPRTPSSHAKTTSAEKKMSAPTLPDSMKPAAQAANSKNPTASSQPLAPGTAIKLTGKRPTAKQLLDLLMVNYAAMKSFKIEGISNTIIKQDGKIVQQEKDIKFSTTFKRPNKFILTTPEGQLYSDGKMVYNCIPKVKRYVKTKMNGKLMEKLAKSKIGIGVMGLAMGTNYSSGVSSASILSDEKVAGTDCYVLSVGLRGGVSCPPGIKAVQKLWIGKKDLGIYRNELDIKDSPKAPKGFKGKVPKLIESTTTSTLTGFHPNISLPDSAFTFRPPAGVKLYQPPKPVNLENKPAPEIPFTWTDGSSKKLSDFKGKVVILDFWGLPMCQAHVPVLQSIYNHNKSNLELVAINVNENRDKVAEYLKKKNCDFPVVYANAQMASVIKKSFGLITLPTIYIIDAKGIIRDEIIGFPTEKDIDARLSKIHAAK